MDLATDANIPLISTLPPDADPQQAGDWLDRQRDRLVDEVGYSFCIADRHDDHALGAAGLWTRGLYQGRATAGYSVAPRERGRGFAEQALTALTAFGWTLRDLHRIELYIEPWNVASLRTATRCGYQLEGRLRSHQEIAGRRVDMLLHAALRPLEPDRTRRHRICGADPST